MDQVNAKDFYASNKAIADLERKLEIAADALTKTKECLEMNEDRDIVAVEIIDEALKRLKSE